MNEKKIGIKLNRIGIGDEYPVAIMGIINLSHESFFKASFTEETLVASRAREMIDSGAAILDIGGRSTAPQSGYITVDEEKERVTHALRSLFRGCDIGDTLVSVDTQFTEVGIAAYELFVEHGKGDSFVLNDVSCLVADPKMPSWLAEIGRPVVIMAGHSLPGDSIGIEETIEDLSRGIERLDRAGFDTAGKLIVDPAIGKWVKEKDPGRDCELVANLGRFRKLGKPILAGISRKSFIGSILGRKDPDERFNGTLAATAIAVFNGAHIVRTHDVTKATIETVRLAEAIRRERLVSGSR